MKVTMYTKPNCAFCDRAKLILKSRKIEYDEIDIGSDISREEFMEKYPDVRTAPLIIIDEKRIGGYIDLMNYLENKNDECGTKD